jgi:hypothetical protein
MRAGKAFQSQNVIYADHYIPAVLYDSLDPVALYVPPHQHRIAMWSYVLTNLAGV